MVVSRAGLILGVLASCGCAGARPIAFTDVNVIDVVEGVVVPGMTVVVSGEQILSIGREDMVLLPGDATVIDGSGRYLMPGLWDMHVHTSIDYVTREVLFPLFIANGVTGIRSMAADCFESGQPDCVGEHLSAPLPSIRVVDTWRRDIESGALTGPRILAGSYNLNGPAPGDPSTPQNPGTPKHARAHVGILKERRVDFIKVYSQFPRDAYFALADEARRQDLPLSAMCP